jgi:hypothetical protein
VTRNSALADANRKRFWRKKALREARWSGKGVSCMAPGRPWHPYAACGTPAAFLLGNERDTGEWLCGPECWREHRRNNQVRPGRSLFGRDP